MDKIRNLFFDLLSAILVLFSFSLRGGDVFFCCIKDLNLIFCSELLSNEYKVFDLETGRLPNGFVSLLSSMPHSLLLSMLWLTWFARQIHRREDDVLTYINARMARNVIIQLNKLLIQFEAQFEIEKWMAENTKPTDDHVVIDLI